MRRPTPLPTSLEHGPFSVAEARGHGVSAGRLRHPGLARPFHGIRSAERIEDDDVVTLARALALRLPADAFLCSVTAARLWRMPLPRRAERREVHVGVPAPRRALAAQGTVGHKLGVTSADLTMLHGMRVTTPERTWCDLATTLRLPDLVAAGDHLVRRGKPLATIGTIAEAMTRHPGRRGRPLLRQALPLLDARAESPMESVLRVTLLAYGLEGFEPNVEVITRSGRHRVDLGFVDARVAVEYQGDYHRDPEQWRRDMTRISRLESHGWRVVQVNADDLADPGELVRRIRRVLLTRHGDR